MTLFFCINFEHVAYTKENFVNNFLLEHIICMITKLSHISFLHKLGICNLIQQGNYIVYLFYINFEHTIFATPC